MRVDINGVEFSDLRNLPDERGVLTEVFREEWHSIRPVQWNVVSSQANVVRGLHAHTVHTDVLTVISGSLVLGLVDLRPQSATHGKTAVVRMQPLATSVLIPVGVGHLFCFDEATTFAYGVTDYWDPEDELGCRWDDPDLGFELPVTDPFLSERDRHAGSLHDLKSLFSAQL